MSKEKFTKGPWQVVFAAGFDAEIGVGMDSYLKDESDFYTNHLWTCEVQSEDADDECLANAALIAAAPEMYGMLEYVKRSFELMVELEVVKCAKDKLEVDIAAIESLLAKARGE